MFRGSFTVMVTPFTASGALDEAALKRFVNWQIDKGTHGLIALGSTGEFLSVSRDERGRLTEILVKEAAGRVPVLIGTAAEWTDEAVALSREAESLGADGLMIIPPFYSSPTEDELFVHYRRIGEAAGIPIMVYNNPFTSNVDLSPAFVARLSEIDAIRYVKESSGDVTRVTRIGTLAGDRITVFAGYHPWESFRAGAGGYVSVFANIAPDLSARLFDVTTTDPAIAPGLAICREVTPLLDAIAGDLYVSATKAALEMIGQPVGPPRPPRLPLPEARRPALRKVLASLGLVAGAAAA